jgi:hypothetical protein
MTEQKRRIIEASNAPGQSASWVARRDGGAESALSMAAPNGGGGRSREVGRAQAR